MTALDKYQRLEAAGLWRASPDAQRRDVIVSIGDASLVITDHNDTPLAHWSIPAVERANPGRMPAIYHPDGDPDETVELPVSEQEMIDAIEKLRSAVERRRPRPGRLRVLAFAGSLAAVAALGVFWLPGAARTHAVSVVPDVKRTEIGQVLLAHVQKITGPACRAPQALPALNKLARRLPGPAGAGTLHVVRSGVRDTVSLPGQITLLHQSLIEDHETPDVIAGYLIAERLRTQSQDPLNRLLAETGLWTTIHLLTTGTINPDTLRAYAETLLKQPQDAIDPETLLSGFAAARVRAAPYAYAIDISGESTLNLIEADPYASTAPELVLSDGDWLRLQLICGG